MSLALAARPKNASVSFSDFRPADLPTPKGKKKMQDSERAGKSSAWEMGKKSWNVLNILVEVTYLFKAWAVNITINFYDLGFEISMFIVAAILKQEKQ